MNSSALLILLLLVVCSAGCEALNPPDTAATLAAQNNAILMEATGIPQTLSVQATQMSATVAAGGTHVAVERGVNRSLLATARAVAPPTQAVAVAAFDIATTVMSDPSLRRFVSTGTSTRVLESDGCIASPQTSFSVETPRIYATARAYNIAAGERVRVQWLYEQNVAWEEAFNMAQSAEEICLWFYIEPAFVAFTPGAWSVNFSAEGFVSGTPINFTITP